jgi:hypothetical protein
MMIPQIEIARERVLAVMSGSMAHFPAPVKIGPAHGNHSAAVQVE